MTSTFPKTVAGSKKVHVLVKYICSNKASLLCQSNYEIIRLLHR